MVTAKVKRADKQIAELKLPLAEKKDLFEHYLEIARAKLAEGNDLDGERAIRAHSGPGQDDPEEPTEVQVCCAGGNGSVPVGAEDTSCSRDGDEHRTESES